MDDEGTMQFHAFHGGVGQEFTNNVGGLVGSATYTGKAAGAYVLETITPNGEVDDAASGYFTANATLECEAFGGVDIATSQQYQINGSITGFMDGENEIEGIGTVNLGTVTGLDDDVNLAGGTTTVTRNDNDVTGAEMGAWSGTFFGNGEETTDPPMGVTGMFDARLLNGTVAGAFGATR